jgi:hypothetical protein
MWRLPTWLNAWSWGHCGRWSERLSALGACWCHWWHSLFDWLCLSSRPIEQQLTGQWLVFSWKRALHWIEFMRTIQNCYHHRDSELTAWLAFGYFALLCFSKTNQHNCSLWSADHNDGESWKWPSYLLPLFLVRNRGELLLLSVSALLSCPYSQTLTMGGG